MTLEQEGIYVRLLAYCWREGSIPADAEACAALCKGGSTTAIRVVQARFNQHPETADRLVHPRLEAERQKNREWRAKSAEGGRRSAQKRQQKSAVSRVVQPPYQPKTNRAVEPTGNTSSAFSSSSSSSILNASESREIDPDLERHTHKAPQNVCVPKSKFTLEQIREYAWDDYRETQRAISLGVKAEGIRNPEGWAIAAHRSGEFDEHVQQWLEERERAVG